MESGQQNISLEIDRQNQIFRLSSPVFSGYEATPKAIAKYFTSQPQGSAYLSLENETTILFQEELSFSRGPQTTMRHQFYQFLRRARQCQHLLSCAKQEERLHDANSLLES